MSEQIRAKKFQLEITDGGRVLALIDGKEVPKVESFYVTHDVLDDSFDIQLYHVLSDGYMATTEVLLGL